MVRCPDQSEGVSSWRASEGEMPMPLQRIETARQILRRPQPEDAREILARYASDADVTRFMSWPRHQSIDDTRAFILFSDAEWGRWPAGPLLVHRRSDGLLLGSTGYAFESPEQAATGYVFAKDAWGQGYATEALRAVVEHASALGIVRLHAHCHADHRASARVLEKCGFVCQGVLRAHTEFPNLERGRLFDVLSYALALTAPEGGISLSPLGTAHRSRK
jgi:ribosomal-protein-alanine N-acetyltransferase